MERPLTMPAKIFFMSVGIVGGVAGLVLMFFPSILTLLSDEIRHPFTAVFLGASFFTSLGGILIVAQNRWSQARVQLPAIMVVSASMLLVTLIHRNVIHWGQPISWLWLLAYLTIFLGSLLIYNQQERTFESPVFLEERMTIWFLPFFVALAAISGVIGLALLFSPQTLIPVWPWSLTPLAARLVGGWWLGAAMLNALLSVQVSWKTVWPGIFSIVVASIFLLVGMMFYFTEFDGPSRSKFLFMLYNFGVAFLAALLWRFGYTKD